MDQIEDLSSGDLTSSLSGLVSGVSVSSPSDNRPGEVGRINIRQNSLMGDFGGTQQDPLYVIDGYIYPLEQGAAAFNNLDPSMIESISFLKDASAAVYGVRAANGVILVTTKKGKIGAPVISYSGSFGLTDEVSRPKMLDSYQYGQLWDAVRAADPTETKTYLTTDLFQKDELEAMRGLNYDLLDKYWKSAWTQKHSVNLSGATEKANYYAGISYFDQEGNLGKLDYDRWNYRAGVDLKIGKWIKANLQVSGDYSDKKNPNNKIGGTNNERDYNLLLLHPYYIPEYVNGYPVASFGVTNQMNYATAQTYHFDTLQNNGDYKRNMTSNMTINTGLEYDFGWSKILKGLKLKFTYSKSINNTKGNEFGSKYSVYYWGVRGGSGSHLYSGVDQNTMTGISVDNGNYLARSMSRTDNYQMNFLATYGRDFGLHSVNALFSIERSEYEYEDLSGQKSDPYEFTNGQENGATGTEDTKFTRSESGTLSYIGRLNYAYNNKYLLEFLIRADASTKFAPKNYWGVFPSLSAGWIISEEDWFKKNVSWIDYLKLRGSFGLTGRDNIAAWQWMQTYGLDADKGAIFGTGTSTNSTNRIVLNKNNAAVNPDAHWDKDYKGNIGLDFNVLNNRLAVNLEGYYEWNRDMFMTYSASMPGTVGTTSAPINYGKINTYGVELSLNWRDKIGKDFNYKIGVNTGYSDNKILLMDWDNPLKFNSKTPNHRDDVGTWGMQCLGMFRSFQDIDEYFDKYLKKDDGTYGTYMGLSKDKVYPGMLIYKDVRGSQNADGSYNGPDHTVDKDQDQVCLSNRNNPYGLTTNIQASYKGFSLTAQVSASWGGYSQVPADAISIASPSGGRGDYNDLQYTNMPSFWKDMFVYQDVVDGSGNVVVPKNLEAKYPNLRFGGVNGVASTFWRVSGTRVQFSRLTLAYALPKHITNWIGIESCRFNITGQNLLSLYNPYPDNFIDPMTEYGSYPVLRKFTLGVNITF
jgi:TonB-linked SusC/RagA family outer membrane protein